MPTMQFLEIMEPSAEVFAQSFLSDNPPCIQYEILVDDAV